MILVRRRHLAIVVLATGLCAQTVARADIIDRVLAVVNGEIVTLSDVRGAMALGLVAPPAGANPQALGLAQLIDRQLILGEVQRYLPPDPDPAAVAEKVASVRRRFASADAYARALVESGLNEVRVSDLMRDELRIQAYLDERFTAAVQPTEEEAQAYARTHAEEIAREGRPPELVSEVARQRLAAERRQALIAEWLAGLRRRAEITDLSVIARP